MPKGKFFFYLKAQKMIFKGWIYHIVWVRDADTKPPSLQSIRVVNEYLDAFPDELSNIPPKR